MPTMLPGFTDSRWFRNAFPDCLAYGFFPHRHMTHPRAAAAHPRRGRANRRARPRLRGALLPRPPAEAARMSEKLRLGGMALRNGLLVHGPTHWAAAVRDPEGEIRVASGRKPRVHAFDSVPGLRGVARLAEAMAVIPLVKRALPAGAPALPGRERGRSGRRGGDRGDAAAPPRPRSGRRGRRRRNLARPRAARAPRRRHSPPTTASSTRRSPPTNRGRTTRRTRPRSTIAAAPTSSPRCSWPTSRARPCCARSWSGRDRWPTPPWPSARWRPRWRSSPGPSATRTRRLAKALRRPGFELQRHMGTREPDERQLEVGRAALAEILRVETAATGA